MIVVLKHSRNPDLNGGYWHGKPAEGTVRQEVMNLNDASRATRDYIERNGLGGGNWTGGDVFDGQKLVARISYNGRIWSPDGQEIKAD